MHSPSTDHEAWISLALPTLGVVVLVLAGACLIAGSRARRVVGITVALTSLLLPWLMPQDLLLTRALLSLCATLGCIRAIDLLKLSWPAPRRLVHVLSGVDTRRLVRGPPRLLAVPLIQGLSWQALALLGYLVLITPEPRGTLIFWLARWGSVGVMAYAGVSAGYALVRVVYSLLGWTTPVLHDLPLRARSVQELWGQRWARLVSTWLAETVFRPWARRKRPGLGALLAFFGSAAFHAYGVWVALGFVRGASMAACMFGYFIVQAGVMGVERVMGVRRWLPWAGHTWTVFWMLLTAPMFVEPAARVLGQAP